MSDVFNRLKAASMPVADSSVMTVYIIFREKACKIALVDGDHDNRRSAFCVQNSKRSLFVAKYRNEVARWW